MTKHIEEILEDFDKRFLDPAEWDDPMSYYYVGEWLEKALTTLSIKIHEEAIKELEGRKQSEEHDELCDGYCEEMGCFQPKRRYQNKALDQAITYHKGEISKLKK